MPENEQREMPASVETKAPGAIMLHHVSFPLERWALGNNPQSSTGFLGKLSNLSFRRPSWRTLECRCRFFNPALEVRDLVRRDGDELPPVLAELVE
jgi:hypothetical protein